MEKIKQQIIEWSNGNPGAISFLVELLHPKNIVHQHAIIPKLEELKSIRGTNLYVLYSDLCNRSLDAVSILCIKCPPNILEDACSRQDFSGLELVKDYR